MILDGYGLNDKCEHNAVCEAKTPIMDRLDSAYAASRCCFSPYETPEKALLHASMIRDFSSISHGSELLHFVSIPGLSKKSPGSSTFRLKSAWHPQNGAL